MPQNIDLMVMSSLQKARSQTGSFKAENLSPRSRRLMAILPKPKTIQATLSSNLNRVQAEIAEDMHKIKQVQVLTSSFIKEHFERIRPGQVLLVSDLQISLTNVTYASAFFFDSRDFWLL